MEYVKGLQNKWDVIVDSFDQFKVIDRKEQMIVRVLERIDYRNRVNLADRIYKEIENAKSHELLRDMFKGWNALF